jgi:predicted amidohydrolase
MRIATFQRVPLFDDAATVVARIFADLSCADMRGVGLAVFPECHLLGHSYDPATIAARAIDVEEERWQAVFAQLAPIAATVILEVSNVMRSVSRTAPW